MTKFSITQRLILGTLFMSFSVALIMGLVSREFSRVIDAEQHMNAADDVLTVGNQITDDLYKLYKAQEIFDQFLSEQTWRHYFELNQKMDVLLTKMRNARGFKQQGSVVKALNESRIEMNNLLQTATYTINPNFTVGALSTDMLKKIKQTRIAIQDQIKQVMLDQRDDRLESKKLLREQLVRLHSAIFWIALLMLTGGAFFAAYLHRTTLAPLKTLMEAMGKTREDQAPPAIVPVGAPEMRDLTTAFNEMNQKLSQHQKRQQALLSLAMTVAHEVRNPLAAIGTAIQVLEQSYPPEAGDREVFQEVLKEVYRINAIISDLLVFSRPKPVLWEMIAVAGFIEELGVFLRPTFEARRIRFEVIISEDGQTIPGDATQLHRAFLNLLTNGVDAVADGGILRLDVSRKEDGTVRILCEDSGPGIPEENREKVFLPFFTTRKRGTGLGLAIVSDIIERHQGTITVGPGKALSGACFEILLPGSIPAGLAPEAAPPGETHEKTAPR